MEQKNLKREVVKQRFVRSLGCNLFLFPVTIMILSLLIFFALVCFKVYFFGDMALQLEPFQDKLSLVILLFITPGIFAISYALWNDAKLFYQTVSRYRRMRQEKSRIEHLMAQNKVKTIAEIDNLEYLAEVEKYKQSR